MNNNESFECGECPLSVDGMCESDDACPYGCDDKYEEIQNTQHLQHLQQYNEEAKRLTLRAIDFLMNNIPINNETQIIVLLLI